MITAYSMDNYNDNEDDDSSDDRLQLSMSMMEIYNEQCFDLLSSSSHSSAMSGGGSVNSSSMPSLDIKQDSNTGMVTIPGLSSVPVSSLSEAMEVHARGRDYRSSSPNSSRSSRSHLIVMLEVRSSTGSSNNSDGDDSTAVMSRLYLVDLAGSEKSEKANIINKWSTSAQKEAAREARHVNQSLSALGEVMEALDKKAATVPYRNSKLTFLLQNALSASSASRCLLIATLSPTDLSYEESLSTLSFAAKVRNISLGPAARNNSSALRNLEQALKTARNEAKELKKQKMALEEALSISRKGKDGVSRIGDKFNEAKVQQLEEAKRAADLFIQQLSRQLHEANSKLVEEKRQRETMALDAELMQRNLKKALQQLHLHEASAALLRISDDDASSVASKNKAPEETSSTTAGVSPAAHSHHSSTSRHTHSSSHHTPVHAPHPSHSSSHSHSLSSSADHLHHNHSHHLHPASAADHRHPSPALSTHSTHTSPSLSRVNNISSSTKSKPYTVIAAKSHLPPSAFPPNPNKATRPSPKVSPAAAGSSSNSRSNSSNGGFRPGGEPPSHSSNNHKKGGAIAAVQAAEAAAIMKNRSSKDSYDTPPKQFVPFNKDSQSYDHGDDNDDDHSTTSHSILLQDDHHHHPPPHLTVPTPSRASRLPRSSSKQPQPQLVISPSSTVTKKVRAGAGYHPWDDSSSNNRPRLPAAATVITPAAASASTAGNSASSIRRASTGSSSSLSTITATVGASGRRQHPSLQTSPNNDEDTKSVLSAQPSVGSGNMNSAFVRQLPGQKRRSSLEPSPYAHQKLKTTPVKVISWDSSRSAPPPQASKTDIAEELIVPYEEEGPELEPTRVVMGRRLPIPARHSRGDSFVIPSLTTQPGLSERAKASMDAHRARIEKKREEKSRTQLLKEKGRAYGMPSPSSPSKHTVQQQQQSQQF